MESNTKLAGFVITYNREEKILKSTIEKVLSQTIVPGKLLVLDNGSKSNVKKLIEGFNNPVLEYHAMGSNIGPAGAANFGLKTLASQNFEWIYWGDDDDPPLFPDIFEHLIELGNSISKIGAIGSVGGKFDFSKGLLVRYKDEDLKGLLDVDSIGGGQNLLISGTALRETKVFPDAKLFFGFEEFEFLQKLKLKGYRILVSGESMLKHRIFKDRKGIQVKRSYFLKKSHSAIKRDYYSYRNNIYMFLYKFRNWRLVFIFISRALGKMLAGYLKGIPYGNYNFRMMFFSIFDAFRKRMGKTY
ncbi:glycosyltransferase [Salegentibacter sediminis]|uniref:glycosyltransferase n=1 Tax=Salegentibacter sediminis TaxID=1930251 RepID=UPI0009BEDBCA|nr:glycosyltransferase [Salegentibacter sediminis]